MAYICDTPGCEGEAKEGLGGKCMKCATRAAREKHIGNAPGSPDASSQKADGDKKPICRRCGKVRPHRFNWRREECLSCNNTLRRQAKMANKITPEKTEKPKPKRAYKKRINNALGTAKDFEKRAKKAGPDTISELPVYPITVDFAKFPKLHEKLLGLAEKEMRTPGMQLLYLLKDELADLEAKA